MTASEPRPEGENLTQSHPDQRHSELDAFYAAEEPPAELKEALAGIRLKWPPVRGLRESVVEDSPLSDRLEGLIETLTHTAKATLAAPSVYTESDFTAARAALVALFDRQREELEDSRTEWRRTADAFAADVIYYLDEIKKLREQSASLESQLERLKAEQTLTEEEIEHIGMNWRPVALCQMCRDILEKIDPVVRRRLSAND